MRKCVQVEGRNVCNEDNHMKFVKSGFVGGEFRPILSAFDKLRNRVKKPETRGYVLHEQRVYATHRFCAERDMTNSFALSRGESNEKVEI